MLKRKKQTNRMNKKELIFIGSFLIISGMLVVGSKYLYNYLQDKHEENLIETFYKIQEDIVDNEIITTDDEVTEVVETPSTSNNDYIAVIKIPKINLEKVLCAKGTYCNNVNRNIQILKEADYPNRENGNFILAGHSGTGKIAYFKNLYKLGIDDEISIYYNGKEYKYQVKHTYDIEKTGTADIIRNMNKTTLTLITCRQGTNKQIIIISELIEITGGTE